MTENKKKMGRPSKGVRRSIALTMSEDIWQYVDGQADRYDNLSAYLRVLFTKMKNHHEAMNDERNIAEVYRCSWKHY
jgi:hypothetical protein